MGQDRLFRFQNLERERPQPSDPGASASSDEARFEALQPEPLPVPAASPSPAGHLARFEAPAPGAIRLEDASSADQPFIRCARCQGDSNRFARSCVHCGQDLHTPEQRAFNEHLWAGLRQTQQQEAEASEQARAAQLQAAIEEKQARRAYFEGLAREVKRKTEASLEGGDQPSFDLLDPGHEATLTERVLLLLGMAGCAGLIVYLLTHGGFRPHWRLVWILVLLNLGMGLRFVRGLPASGH